MAKTSEKSRRILEDMCRHERSDEKCVLTKKLTKEAAYITIGYTDQLKHIDEKMRVWNDAKDKCIAEKTEVLKDAHLLGVVKQTYYGRNYCALEDDHPDRVAFDKETNKQLKAILTMD